jgi:hypothetical protein
LTLFNRERPIYLTWKVLIKAILFWMDSDKLILAYEKMHCREANPFISELFLAKDVFPSLKH